MKKIFKICIISVIGVLIISTLLSTFALNTERNLDTEETNKPLDSSKDKH